jgi:hypothetical protein
MSFDMKYDRDGRPLVQKQEVIVEQEVIQAAPAQEVQESASQDSGLEVLQQDIAPEVQELVIETPEPEAVPTTPRMDKRLKVLMDKASRMEQERNEAMQRLQDIESSRYKPQKNQQAQQSESIDEDINLGPDELAEGKHIALMQKQMRDMKEQLKNYQQQSATQTMQVQLKTKFPDFDKVVSPENVAVLKELHPEIYQTLSSNNDLYSTGASAYTIIKNLGIHVEDVYQEDRARIQKNAAKPKSLATISPQRGDSPLSQANAFSQGLTPALQKQLIEEMQAARKAL